VVVCYYSSVLLVTGRGGETAG